MTAITLQQNTAMPAWFNKKALTQVLIFALAFAVFAVATAGETGTEFKGLYDLLFGWASGYLGKALAFAALIAGIAAGVGRSSPMLAAIGVVFAILISVGPGIINGILTATI